MISSEQTPALKSVETSTIPHLSTSTAMTDAFRPLEGIDVTTSAKAAEYFPQNKTSILQSVERAKEIALEGFKSIYAVPAESRTFDNTVYAMDELEAFFHSRMQAMWVVSMTHTEREIRDAAKEARDGMKAFFIENFQSNKELYQSFREALLAIDNRGEALTPQQSQYLKDKDLSFKREGLHLDKSDFEVVKELKTEISKLETSFLKNLDEDNSHIWVNVSDLEGVPERVIKSLETREGSVKLTCDYPVYLPVMRYCQVEETRKALYGAFTTRAADLNMPILKQLIAQRDLLARKVGYRSFADYDIEGQMAQTPEKVQEFIDSLAKGAHEKAALEVKELLQELPKSVALTDEGKIKPWDLSYLRECYKNKNLGVDEKAIQEYFPYEPTLKKLLYLYSNFFGLNFKEVSNEGLWHPSTKMIAVYDKGEEGRLIGHVVMDIFPREGKFGHGYCIDVLAPSKSSTGAIQSAIATILANLTPPKEDTPSLLTHGEATTLFHELGHCLHQLLGCAEMPTKSGYHVKIDFLELPSQLLEELLWDPDILRFLSEHYETKKALPEEMIGKKIASRYNFEGYFVLRQMVLASMSLHFFQEGFSKNTKVIREELEKKYLPFMAIYPGDQDEGTFRHLADPLYRSKYYCYSWAEVFAKDVYGHIRSTSGERDINPWMEYRKKVLEPGGGIDPNELLLNLLERKPSMEAYFKTLASH